MTTGSHRYETYYPDTIRLKVARTVLGRFAATGQEYYGYRVQVDTRKPRYFADDDGYNADRAKDYAISLLGNDVAYRSEVMCIHWQNWEQS